jgi:hypothetical protein
VLGVGQEQKERVESGEKENVLGVGDQKERAAPLQHLAHSPFPHFLPFLSAPVQHLAHSPFRMC